MFLISSATVLLAHAWLHTQPPGGQGLGLIPMPSTALAQLFPEAILVIRVSGGWNYPTPAGVFLESTDEVVTDKSGRGRGRGEELPASRKREFFLMG